MLKIVTRSKFEMAAAAVLNFVLGAKFGVIEIFRTEFDTVMEFQQPNVIR